MKLPPIFLEQINEGWEVSYTPSTSQEFQHSRRLFGNFRKRSKSGRLVSSMKKEIHKSFTDSYIFEYNLILENYFPLVIFIQNIIILSTFRTIFVRFAQFRTFFRAFRTKKRTTFFSSLKFSIFCKKYFMVLATQQHQQSLHLFKSLLIS